MQKNLRLQDPFYSTRILHKQVHKYLDSESFGNLASAHQKTTDFK